MKHIEWKFQIPTYWADVKQLRNQHARKRMRHNVDVLCYMFKAMQSDICGYWGANVSDEFKEKAFNNTYLRKHLNKAISELK